MLGAIEYDYRTLTGWPSPSTIPATITAVSTTDAFQNADVTSAALPVPSGTAVGDLLLARITTSSPNFGASSSVTPPSGWTAIVTASNLTATTASLFYRVATAADTSAPSYTFTLGSQSFWSGGITRFTGVDTTTPIDVAAKTATGAPLTLPALTTVATGAYVVSYLAMDGAVDGTWSHPLPSGWTNLFSETTGNNIAALSTHASGTVPSATWNWSGGGGGTDMAGIIVSLRPASSSGGGTAPPTLTQLVRGTDNQNSGAATTTTLSITLTAPAGIQTGDPVVVGIETREPSSTLTGWRAPTGFTLIGNAQSTGDAFLYYGIYGQNGLTGSTFTFDNGAGNATPARWAASLVVLNGTYAGAYQTGTLTAATGSATVSSGSITTTSPTYQVGMAGSRLNGGATWTWPTGWTEEGDTDPLAATNSAGHTSAVYSGTLPAPAGSYSVAPVASQAVVNGYAGIVAFTARSTAATSVAVVQQVTGSAASAANFTTGAVTTTAGNVVALVVGRSGGLATGSITSVTDTTGNTWTKATTGSVSNGTNSRVELWYTTQDVGALTGGTITANSGTAQTNDYSIIELSGVNRSAPLTASSPDGSGVTSATPQTPAVTAHANDLVLSVVHHTYNAAADTVSDSGWTLLTPSVNGTAHLTSAAYQVQSAAGTIGPTWARGGGTSSANGLITASFAAAASGGGGGGTVGPVAVQGTPTWVANTTSASTVAIPVPTGVVAGELLVAQVQSGSGATTIATPSGWTVIQTGTDGNDTVVWVGYKVATGSEPTSYTWTLGAANSTQQGSMFRLANVNTTSPVRTSAFSQSGATQSASYAAPALTGVQATDLSAAFWAGGSITGATQSTPTAPGAPWATLFANASTTKVSVASTATGAQTAPSATAASSTTWSAVSVAFQQAASGGGGGGGTVGGGTITLPYQQDFTGNDGNVWPGEWTTAATTGAVDYQSNRGRLLTASGASSRGAKAYLAGLAGTTDFDVTVDVSFPAISDESLTVFFRTSDTANATTAPANAYGLVLLPNSAGYAIYKWVSGTATNLSGVLPYTWTAGTARRFRVTGTTLPGSGYTLSVTQWDPTQAQPAVLWSGSDTTVTGTGSVLLMPQVGATGSAAITAYVDNIVLAVPQAATSSTVTGVGTGSSTLTGADTITGTLTAAGTGTAALLSGFVTEPGTLAAAGVGSTTLAGVSTETGALSGTGTASSSIGSVSIGTSLAASGTGSSTLSGAATISGTLSAAGTGSAALSGYGTTTATLAATGTGSATVTGFSTVSVTLTASGTGSSTVTVTHTVFGTLTGTGAGNAVLSGQLAISGLLTPTGTGSSSLVDPVPLTITGTLTAVAVGTSSLNTFSSVGVGTMTLTGFNTTTGAPVPAVAVGSSTLTGFVTTTRTVTGTGTGTASITGGVTEVGLLTPTGTGTATLSSGPGSVPASVAATGTGSATLSGFRSTTGTLAASGIGTEALAVTHTVTTTFAAAGVGTSAILNVGLGTTVSPFGVGSATLTGFESRTAVLAASGSGSVTVPFDFTAGPADTLGATGTVTVTRTTPGTPADPSAIASLYQRYVAADIGAAAGAAVTSWTPRTGTGTLTGTGTYQTTGSLINGKPAVRLNGTSNTFTGTIGSAGTTAATVVVVFATTSSAQQELVQISQCEAIINSGDSLQLWSGVNLSSTATVSTGTPHVAAFGTNTSSANYIMLDGTQVASGNAGTPSTGTAFRIGTASGSTRYLNGDVAEVLVFNTQLTAADLATVDSYVQATYGITTADSTPTGNVSTSGSADLAGLTDAATDVQGLVRTPSDTEGITDAVSVTRTVFNTAPASTIAVTDAVARGFGRTIADTEGLTDVGGKAQSVLVPDTLGLTDAEAVYGVFALPVTTTAAPDLETRVGLNDVVSLRGVADVPVDLTGNLVKGPQRAVIDIEAGSSDLTHVVALSGTASVDTAMPKPRLRVVARMSDVLTTQVGGVVQTLVLGNNGPIYSDDTTTLLSDDFSAVRSDLWTYGPTTTVSGGQLVCPCNTSWSSTAVSKAAFDLTGSIIQGQMLSIAGGVADGSGADSWFSIDNNPVSNDNGFNIDISEGQITPSYNIGGVFTSGPSIPYVAARHKWFRYRQAAGTVYFEVSADALSWTALWSWVPTFSITSMYVLLGNGTPAPTAQQPTTYDNVSVLHPGGGPAATGGFETTSTHTETVVWSDDFDSVRSELWTFHSGATVTGGQLSCPFGWLISNNPVSLIGSAIAVQLVSTQTNADGWLSYQAADNSRYLGWEVTGGTLSVNYSNPGGGNVMPWSTAYTPAVHAWLRVREQSGTVYFETSADGTTWTVCYSTPTSTFTFDLTSQIIWLGNDTGGTTTFDNFTVSRIGAPVPTAVYGPTNKPVWKLARNLAVPGGWGSSIAVDVFDDVPAGATVTISLYVRGPVGEMTDLRITNDPATDTVLDPSALPMLAAHDGSWKHYTATVTLPKTWIANFHRLRLGIKNWIEWSDATLTVSMPMQMHGPEPEPQPEPVTDPPRKLDRVFVVLR